MKLKVINIDGNKSADVELSDKIFSLKPNKSIIQSMIDWQQNHFKPRTAKTKQRNEIKGSTAKIYAQKGTGGAKLEVQFFMGLEKDKKNTSEKIKKDTNQQSTKKLKRS